MPYVITTITRRPLHPDDTAPTDAESVSRRAVATLEEARDVWDAALTALGDSTGNYDSTPEDMPEPGGTVGPLPDGTVIEVEPVDWMRIAHDAGRMVPVGANPRAEREAIDAYNAGQA